MYIDIPSLCDKHLKFHAVDVIVVFVNSKNVQCFRLTHVYCGYHNTRDLKI